MTLTDIAHLRVYNQHIAGKPCAKPENVVSWLVAVQAQDYLGSLWGIGQRVKGATEGSVEQAIADRRIVRTWPMRGTIHFLHADDVRWMVELLAPRIIALHAKRVLRDFSLDDNVTARSRDVLMKELEGGRSLERNDVYATLERAGIATGGQRGLHIIGRLAHEGVLCFGPRAGKQPTFVLMEEWVPDARRLERDEALAELARRYFTGHGPATAHDFAWWSGLTLTEARAGLAEAQGSLVEIRVDGTSYWMSSSMPKVEDPSESAFLLPAYDEFTVAYQDRSAALDPANNHVMQGMEILGPVIVINGRVVGTWKRALKKSVVEITPTLLRSLKRKEKNALEEAAERYGAFLELEAAVRW